MTKILFHYRYIFLALVIGLLTIAAYWPSLHYGFSQDDFIHTSASATHTAIDVFQFFNPFHQYSDIFFYRPLATQLYFFTTHAIFGWNPIAFHTVDLFFHLLNCFLIFVLVRKIWRRIDLAALCGMLYGIAAIHFLSLYYISSFQETLHVTWLLIGLWCVLQATKSLKYLWLASLAFVLALLSKETAIIFPLLAIIVLRYEKVRWKTIAVVTLPLVVIAVGYIVLRVAGLHSLVAQGGYGFSVSPKNLLQNVKWYTLWSFGLPEILASYPSLSTSSLIQFGHDFPQGLAILASFAITIVLSAMSISLTAKRDLRTIGFALLFVLAALLPVLLLTDHKYPQYLDLPYLVLLPIFFPIHRMTTKWQRGIVIAAVISFGILQLYSLQLSQQTHWTTHRSMVAVFYQNKIKSMYPAMPNHSIIAFVGSPIALQNVSVALANQYAVKLWYPTEVIRVVYQTPDQSVALGTLVIPVTQY